MKNKIVFPILFVLAIGVISLGVLQVVAHASPAFQTATASVEQIATQMSASGTIHSQNEATLHFQTNGKVISLPYKVGDSINQGAIIAQLDTYTLQRQLTAALNTYRTTRDTFDQQQINNQNGTLQKQQKTTLDASAASPVDSVDVINDIAKRVLDQNQATLDNSVINVELANYALQLSSLTSPINGVVTAEDITLPNVNITPVTSFSVADPSLPIFKAHVDESDIDYVTTGAPVTITLNGQPKQLSGTVTQIEPLKQTDSSGSYYVVDIQSDNFKQYAKLGQSGNVLITNALSGQHIVIPRWAVLGHTYVWILVDNQPVLKQVITGTIHGDTIEILQGLSPQDIVVTNPQAIAKTKYTIL